MGRLMTPKCPGAGTTVGSQYYHEMKNSHKEPQNSAKKFEAHSSY